MRRIQNWDKLRIQIILMMIMVLDPLATTISQISTGVNSHLPFLIPGAIAAALVFLHVRRGGALETFAPTVILLASFMSLLRIIYTLVTSGYGHGPYANSMVCVGCWFIAQTRFRNCLIYGVYAIVANIVLLVVADQLPVNPVQHIAGIITLFLVEGLVMGIYFGYQRKLAEVNRILAEQVQQEHETSSQLVSASKKMNHSIQVQSQALVETSASIDQIKATSTHNLEALEHSRTIILKFADSVVSVEKARKNIERNLDSIGAEVDQLNVVVEQSRAKFDELARVLAEIGRITRIMNDFVFQSKLLSFNASIEAARAGEQGKGFSVVAGEVGTLAQNSGQAAKEIERIVSESKVLFDRVRTDLATRMTEAHRTIADHIKNARGDIQANAQTFDEIFVRSKEIKGNTDAVITAIGEIDYGLAQITGAMGTLNQVNQDILKSTEDTRVSVDAIDDQVQHSQEFLEELKPLISPFVKDAA